MSLFTKENCTFSAISGVITRDGKPLPHVRIIRKTHWKSPYQDETRTDELGKFAMPALFERESKFSFPMEYVVNQEMLVEVEGEQVQIWDGVKRQKEENAESQGKPLMVTCDVSKADETVFWGAQIFTTKCQWDVITEEPKRWEDMFESNGD